MLRDVTRYCCAEGLEEITFYALSTENYRRRPRREISDLMGLLKSYLISEREEIMEQHIQMRSIGRVGELPRGVIKALRQTEEMSAGNDGMVLRLALNYGARGEIVDAVKAVVRDVEHGKLSARQLDRLDEEGFKRYLYDAHMVDPDLLVRSAGEHRISNFLLWQISYAEIWITDVPWPEFTVDHVRQAIADYGSRERRFGQLRTPESHV